MSSISLSNDTLNYTIFLLAYSLESLLPNGEQAEQLRAGTYRNFPVLLKYFLRAS